MTPIIRGRRGFAVLGCDPTGTIRTRRVLGVVDVLSCGAQKLIPPTPHPSGSVYLYSSGSLAGLRPEDLGLIRPDVADCLAEALAGICGHHQRIDGRRAPLAVRLAELSEHECSQHRHYAKAILTRELSALAAMPPNSGRNRAAFRLACRLGRWVHAGLLPGDQLTTGVLESCRANGLLAEDGARAVQATIASGLRWSAHDGLPDLSGARHA
jgi:hypothetical protein